MGKVYAMSQILELKKQMENQRMLELARIESERQQQVSRIQALVAVMEEQLCFGVSPELIEHRSSYLSLQAKRVHCAELELHRICQVKDQAHERLLLAAVDRKKFELHRDSFLANARCEELCREQAQGDEAATQIYLREKEVRS